MREDKALVAQVIINSTSKQTDKKFDYLIPHSLDVSVGTRVIIPFGISNKHVEGYVMGITEHSSAKKLKEIISSEPRRVFDEKTVELIEWIREKYLCTYIDVIKLIIPSGTGITSETWIIYENDCDNLTSSEKKLVDAVKPMPIGCELTELLKITDVSRAVLNKLIQKKCVRLYYKTKSIVKDKSVRVVRLCLSADDAYKKIEELKNRRAFAQAKALEVLLSCDIISAADLVNFCNCSHSTLSALKKSGVIDYENVVVERKHQSISKIIQSTSPVLTIEQENACTEIRNTLVSGEFCEFLLHGVTGSGKTEVFLNTIKAVTDIGKQAIVLVPEISLTPQMVERFTSRFGERVAVFHSKLSAGERFDEWKKMSDGRADIAIGARSAIFAPFDNIGVIIMDEEHESSYKSEVSPRYNTKEVARFRAHQYSCPLICASATPEVGAYFKAVNGKTKLLELKSRINKRDIPFVDIIDMRNELSDGNKSVFSRRLITEIEKNLKNKEQTILLMNRRGFSTFVSCRECGFVASCPNCNISLTYHKFNDELKCHYCGYTRKNYIKCPKCNSNYIRYFGGGTQRVEEEIKKVFPEASTIRMDIDTTSKQNSHEKLLHEFSQKGIDILIGTQMVAKGLDFPNVTLVGVVSADTILNIDDYRSGERAFDLLEQVTGRAGRAEKPGRAIIQTYSPEHNAVVFAAKHDYKSFYNHEINMRKSMQYPPFCDMVSVLFVGENEEAVSKCSKLFAKNISPSNEYKVLGPVPAQITKIKNKYRWRILIKCRNADRVTNTLVTAREICNNNTNYEKISIIIDKNPNNIY